MGLARIVVVGSSCAGKTTFARQLAERMNAAHIELDALYWGANWTPRSDEEFSRLIDRAMISEIWVADGNYSKVRDILWSQATHIIWLNYSFPCVFGRGLKRTIVRSITRRELWQGNRESIRQSFFSRDSILLWTINTFHDRKRNLSATRANGVYPHLSWLEFRHPKDAERWLAALND